MGLWDDDINEDVARGCDGCGASGENDDDNGEKFWLAVPGWCIGSESGCDGPVRPPNLASSVVPLDTDASEDRPGSLGQFSFDRSASP